MAIKSILQTIRSVIAWPAEVEQKLASALERRERLLLWELGDAVATSATKAITAEVESRINPTPTTATQPSSSSVPHSTKPSPEKQPVRDQSEDRKLPDFFVIAVDNPQGHPGRTLYAVWHRALNHRVSAWFESPWAAHKMEEFSNESPRDWASKAAYGSAVISNAAAEEMFA